MLKDPLTASIKKHYENKCILVTGSTGYIASGFINTLKDIPCRIIRVSRPDTIFKPLKGVAHISDVSNNISSYAAWEELLDKVDYVFHFAAAITYADDQSPKADFVANFMPMQCMLETCWSKQHHPVIVFAGTVTEVGHTSQIPVDESQPDLPITTYDIHKLMAEDYLKYFTRRQVVKGTSLRLANVYGPGPKWSSVNRGVLNIMIRRALNHEPLTIYDTGEYIRDFIYIADVVQAFLQAGVYIDQLNGQHYVIGQGKGYTLAEAIHMVANRIKKKTGHSVTVQHVDPPKPLSRIETRNFTADTTRFTEITNWHAQVSLEEGIDNNIDYYLAQGHAMTSV